MKNNCVNCKHNVANQCENTNWKDGKFIVNPVNPPCGYLTKSSKNPIGFTKVK